jgi:hypothetical protein
LQLVEARRICNYLLIGASLPEEDQQWLLDNLELDSRMLNRILRFPDRSPLISAWVRKNFNSTLFCERRAEATSWLIDEDLEFVLDKSILIADTEWVNHLDQMAIEAYVSGVAIFDLVHSVNLERDEDEEEVQSIETGEYPKLNLAQRYYGYPVNYSEALETDLPDYDKILKDQRKHSKFYHYSTMMWSIAYSRLSTNTKTRLLKKYYSDDTYHSFMNIAKRYKYVGLLRWLENELD